jgi:NAD(P)-dependent dehydrogenase (short-subunit alcohol dehydrogenase family)
MKKVLITGSARRLGKALALKFASIGYDIVLHYNNSDERAKETVAALEKYNINVDLLKADLSNSDESVKILTSYFENCINSNLKIPNILINNAGIYPHEQTLDELDINLWNKVLNLNTRAALITSKIFSKYAHNNSRIINIGSLGAVEIWRNKIPYNVSKAALLQLTKALARSLAPKISVNCINPGYIEMPNDPPEAHNPLTVDKIPMKRFGTTDDIFDAALFFAESSGFITGQYLNIDGGTHLVK